MKKNVMLLMLITMCVSAFSATRSASISIDSRKQYQHVTGFGGFSPSPTWQYWLSDSDMDKLFGKGDSQLGLNILRLYMANSENGWSSGLANAKRAKKHGAFIFASPWSPPASWKTNNSDSNGGALLESRYADWANFLNNYYKYMKNNGVEIDAVSIQNEPDWNAEYQSCIWTGEQMAKFLREQGSKIACKIIAPEAIHFTKSVHEPILNDEKACKNLGILGGHFYGWDGSAYPLATQKGKEVWMTEFLINERQENDKLNINWKDDGFLFARSINDAMLANMSAWVHYSLKRYYGCIGDGNYGTTNNQITKRGYVLSQYAKYVSGTTRIAHALTDASGKLTSSAYISSSDDSVVVMIINPSADTYNTTLTLPFNSAKKKHIVTTETKNASKTDWTAMEETYSPVVSLEPYSVNTFIFEKSSPRTDLPDIDVDGESLFADNFDLYGASCVPAGWKVIFEEGTRYAGSYSLGPRIMGFSAEGLMQYAFYFRTNTADKGYLTYGEDDKYRLSLDPGKYTLSYSTLGWKAKPTLAASVQTLSGTVVKSLSSTPEYTISANGSSARVTQVTSKSLDFEITTSGNYVLKWVMSKSSAGLNEALVGNIKLIRHNDEPSGITSVEAESKRDNAVYDLYGRRLLQVPDRGIYIMNGKKYVEK